MELTEAIELVNDHTAVLAVGGLSTLVLVLIIASFITTSSRTPPHKQQKALDQQRAVLQIVIAVLRADVRNLSATQRAYVHEAAKAHATEVLFSSQPGKKPKSRRDADVVDAAAKVTLDRLGITGKGPR